MTDSELISHIRVVDDYPKKGIHFQDVTTLFKNPECLHELQERICELYKDKGITKVIGLESRGFVMGAIIAEKLGAGFVLARKHGKLPGDVYSEEYSLEYGTNVLEIHKDALEENDVVLIHDDLIATGGSMAAAARLAQRFSPKAIYQNVIIELTAIPHCKELTLPVDSIIKVDYD